MEAKLKSASLPLLDQDDLSTETIPNIGPCPNKYFDSHQCMWIVSERWLGIIQYLCKSLITLWKDPLVHPPTIFKKQDLNKEIYLTFKVNIIHKCIGLSLKKGNFAHLWSWCFVAFGHAPDLICIFRNMSSPHNCSGITMGKKCWMDGH